MSTLSSFQLFLANFEPIRGHTLVPYTPYTNVTIFSTFLCLCGEHSTLATSPHHQTTTRYSDIHIAPWMDTGGRSSEAPCIEMGSIFRSPRSFCRSVQAVPRGWSRFHSWKRRWTPEVLFLRRAPVAKRAKKPRPGAPPQIRVCTDIWDTYHTTSHSNGLM